ncbi:alpha-glucosidase [Patella vulgata]|uniref:alpha-glucosidase n=1 Tax=Patella vulgata TaxID=6465 RepID=UPI0024A856E3|nr:alpha-glucosidase [Patella vulgata]
MRAGPLLLLLICGLFCKEITAKSKLKWWQTSIIYQIYPRSFKDSDGDGVGDLKGIISKIDHFVYIGVKAIWLSPFYPSPMKDFGYDISNHTDVDPVFGTLDDFRNLLTECHKKDIKVIIDFVPNHTSDLHPWFRASIRNEEPYKDFYVWTDGIEGPDGTRIKPNNWLSVFGGEVWKWNEQRQQFYYHAFLESQPDLNYRNPKVIEEMNNVIRFWSEMGVDGIRVDAITNLYEVADVSLNEPLSGKPGVPEFQYEYLNHIYSSNLPEIEGAIRGWRNAMNEFANEDESRFMVVELYDTPDNRNAYLGYGCDLPFNFDLVDPGITADCGGRCMRDLVDIEYSSLPKNSWPNFVLGNHDRKRITKKRGPGAANAMNMLLLTLRGTPTTYYGEEIGMIEVDVPFEDTKDPWGINYGKERYTEFTRDPCRTPLQWSGDYQSGFTTAEKPWLPIHANYKTLNVEAQKASKELSPLQLYKQLGELRENPAFQYGDLIYAVVNDNIFSYIRNSVGDSRYLVTINFGKTNSKDDYTDYTDGRVLGRIIAHTGNMKNEPYYKKDMEIPLNGILLQPDQGLVIELLNKRQEL